VSAADPARPDAPPLDVRGLAKRYRRREAVAGVDLHVGPGEVVGLLGPNGAGKTTTVKVVLGLVRPDAGDVRVFGRPAGDPAARRHVGYLPEQFRYPEWLTGLQVLHAHGRLAGLAAEDVGPLAEDALRRVGLAGRGDDRVGGYSKGMQQRLGLATAVIARPRLVILDEPTSALDPIGRREVRDLIRALRDDGAAVLLNSHLLGEVEQVCDRVVIIDRGAVVQAGSLADLAVGAEVRLTLDRVDETATALLEGFGAIAARDRTTVLLALDDPTAVPDLAAALVGRGYRLHALVPLQRSLEDVFVGLIDAGSAAGGRAS
jgi:ABC-2 type transport system ATP-binding protein